MTKPQCCPFCGSTTVRVRRILYYGVHCQSCFAFGPIAKDKNLAIRQWNEARWSREPKRRTSQTKNQN